MRLSLSTPAPRRHLHTRTIACEGYRREDGLWDIEARIIDRKTFSYSEPYRGLRAPGEPIHNMAVRLTIDSDMVVRDIEVATLAAPYAPCFGVAPSFKALIGKQIGAGWRRAVQECVGGVKGCTHIRELLFPLATVAFQTLGSWTQDARVATESDPDRGPARPHFLDGCTAFAVDGEVVARLFPLHYRKSA